MILLIVKEYESPRNLNILQVDTASLVTYCSSALENLQMNYSSPINKLWSITDILKH